MGIILRLQFIRLLKTNGLHYMIIFTVFIVMAGAGGILFFEKEYGHINDISDAVWWSIVTTTTVGYGDISPASLGGRILAAILMLVGIGFLGMVTGSIATFFVEGVIVKKHKKTMLDERIEYIQEKLSDIQALSQEDISMINRMIYSVWEDAKNTADTI